MLALRSHPDKNPGDQDAAARFRDVTNAYKRLSLTEVAYKSHDELCAEMDDVRAALIRATELASRVSIDDYGQIAKDVRQMLKIGSTTWMGEVSEGRPQGSGDLILPNGAVHHGEFASGRASGAGVLYEASGSVMRGYWVENKRHGSFETTDPKGGLWYDTYDNDGKRTSRKKGAPPPVDAHGAVKCTVCGVKFHPNANFKCVRHSGKWMEAPTHNADGSPAIVDRIAFPDGGLWLCCGSKSKEPKDGDRGCTVGSQHVAAAATPPVPVPEARRLEEGRAAIPSFIESSFSTKVEYDAWRRRGGA